MWAFFSEEAGDFMAPGDPDLLEAIVMTSGISSGCQWIRTQYASWSVNHTKNLMFNNIFHFYFKVGVT